MSPSKAIGQGFCLAVVVSISCVASFTQGPPVPSPDKRAVEVYKNIQVLKDVPSDQLIPAMQFITSSLGVQCGYCHVENAFDKDDKKTKQTARKMMEMMITIDAENFQGKQMVTCYSCHRGSPMPVAIPAIPQTPPRLLAEAVQPGGPLQPSLPKAEDVIEKYISALGGASAISKLTSLDAKGTVEVGGRQFPIEILVQSPDRIATIMQWPNGSGGSVFDGRSGWSLFPARPPRPMTPAEVDANRQDANLHFALELKNIFSELKTAREAKVGEQDAIMISGQRPGMPPIDLYFDKQSGLLIRELRYGQSPLGLNPTQIDYSDFRVVAGVKVPFHWTSATPTGRVNTQLESAQADVAIPPSAFEKPAEVVPSAAQKIGP
jgi:photosynthetic reaction center cytochrome c subunit